MDISDAFAPIFVKLKNENFTKSTVPEDLMKKVLILHSAVNVATANSAEFCTMYTVHSVQRSVTVSARAQCKCSIWCTVSDDVPATGKPALTVLVKYTVPNQL